MPIWFVELNILWNKESYRNFLKLYVFNYLTIALTLSVGDAVFYRLIELLLIWGILGKVP